MNKERAIEILTEEKQSVEKVIENVSRALCSPILTKDNKYKILINNNEEFAQALDLAIESLKNNEWRDVNVELPNDNEEVLTCVDSGNHKYIIKMTYEEKVFYENVDGWSDDQNTDKVIAWKPLPEPYERSEE